jgi:peptidyl-prolyl cis-trans isomerase SurA
MPIYKKLKKTCRDFASVGLLTLASLASLPTYANQNIDSIIAIVKDDIIFAQELEQKILQAKVRLQARNKKFNEKKLKTQLLDALILEKLQLSLAKQNNLNASEAEIEKTIARTKTQLKRNGTSYQEYLDTQKLSETQAKKEIEKEVLISKIQQGVISQRINITDTEVDNYLESKEGKEWLTPRFHIGQIFFPYTPKNKQKTMLNAKKLYQELRNHPDQFSEFAQKFSQGPNAAKGGDIGIQKKQDLPPLFVDRIITMKPGDIAEPFFSDAGVHILSLFDRKGAEPVIVTQYKVRHILVKPTDLFTDEEAQKKILALREKIVAGADFITTAKKNSDDIGSKLDGGDLGWSSPGMFVPAFETAMQTTAIDTISQPFTSTFGWHILIVEGQRSKNIFDDVKRSQVRNIIGQQRFQDELAIWLKELRESAYVEILI